MNDDRDRWQHLRHEIGNCLNFALAAHAEACERSPSSDRALLEALADVGTGLHRIRDLISGAAARAPVTALNLASLVDEALHQCRHALDGVRTKRELPAEITISGRREPLRQMLVNLLLNAIAAIHRGGEGAGCVHLSARRVDDHVQLRIGDDGGGMSLAIAEQLNAGRAPAGDPDTGHGYGLAVCQQVLHELGGSLSVEPAAAGGCRICCHLPGG